MTYSSMLPSLYNSFAHAQLYSELGRAITFSPYLSLGGFVLELGASKLNEDTHLVYRNVLQGAAKITQLAGGVINLATIIQFTWGSTGLLAPLVTAGGSAGLGAAMLIGGHLVIISAAVAGLFFASVAVRRAWDQITDPQKKVGFEHNNSEDGGLYAPRDNTSKAMTVATLPIATTFLAASLVPKVCTNPASMAAATGLMCASGMWGGIGVSMGMLAYLAYQQPAAAQR